MRESTSSLKTYIQLKEQERKRIADDTERFLVFRRNNISVVKQGASAHNMAESMSAQQRNKSEYRKAQVIEVEAASAKKKIRTIAEVVRRHKKRSAAQ